MLTAGVTSLGESRIENVEALRRAGVDAEIMLVRSPMMSQADRVVAGADLSLNSEIDVIERLSASACEQRRQHGIVLMVELGDLREGIMPCDLHEAVREVLDLPGVVLRGIGANLACQSGVVPDGANMAELSSLAASVEGAFGIGLEIVSGGNSANLDWALDPDSDVGRINHLRLGESILLGREPLRRSVPDGLRTDAFTLVGEVIESKLKPSRPRGRLAQAAFGPIDESRAPRAAGTRVIVALGRQDVDHDGITPPDGYVVLGASSDHLVLATDSEPPPVGSEFRFDMDYSALLRAMTSPFVTRRFLRSD
jgi:predicted amino acid racemase